MRPFTHVFIATVHQEVDLGLGDLESGSWLSLSISAEMDRIPTVLPPQPVYDPSYHNTRVQPKTYGSSIDANITIPLPVVKATEEPLAQDETQLGQQDTFSGSCLGERAVYGGEYVQRDQK